MSTSLNFYYETLNTCHERHSYYPNRKTTLKHKKNPRRIEQGILKMIVEMAYEMDACDMVVRIVKSLESDFMMFKTMKTRKHLVQNYSISGGAYHACIDVMSPCVKLYEPVDDVYDERHLVLPMVYDKAYKGIVFIGGTFNENGMYVPPTQRTKVSDFAMIRLHILLLLYYYKRRWQKFTKRVPNPMLRNCCWRSDAYLVSINQEIQP